jgi:lysophospholipase L1-like esterase
MVTAISGRGVVMNNANAEGPKLPDIYPEQDYYNNRGVAYDFALQPDVIVINLGTNDATNTSLTEDAFKAGVVNFIQLVRRNNPHAQIIWAYGLRQDTKTEDVATWIGEAVAQTGDTDVHYLPLDLVPSTQTDLNHPLAAGYTASGEKLITKIGEITGW